MNCCMKIAQIGWQFEKGGVSRSHYHAVGSAVLSGYSMKVWKHNNIISMGPLLWKIAHEMILWANNATIQQKKKIKLS